MAARKPLSQIKNSNQRKPEAKGASEKSFAPSVMVRNPPSLSSVSTTSRTSSNYPPSVFSDCETDDEDSSMSADEHVPSRPLSVPVPKAASIHGPYCPRKPNLREILANTAEAPWTLAAFMAYLSNNHCLETLEFTMDAGRYKKHYSKMMAKAGSNGIPPSKDREYVQALWERLVDAYIQPSGSREVNIPSDVRDPILRLRPDKMPPSPDKLDPAVAKIYELMEDSVLVPFLNSVYPQTPHPTIASHSSTTTNEHVSWSRPVSDDRSLEIRQNRNTRNSPPPNTSVEPYSRSYNPPSTLNRKSAPITFHPMSKASANTKLSQTTSSPARVQFRPAAFDSDPNYIGSGSGPGMTDDGGTDSPAYDSPTTPPTSPPLSDSQSPKRDSGMWKKLGRIGAAKASKKRSDGGLREEQ